MDIGSDQFGRCYNIFEEPGSAVNKILNQENKIGIPFTPSEAFVLVF